MGKNWFGALAICCVTVLAASTAIAQQSGGVQVRGNTNINVNARNINTIAIGQGNVAKTNIATVKANKRGNTNVSVDARNVQNIVGGRGRKGCINIGTHGTDPDCQ